MKKKEFKRCWQWIAVESASVRSARTLKPLTLPKSLIATLNHLTSKPPFFSPAVTHKQTLDEESRKAKKRGECLHFTLEVARDQLEQLQALCKI